jgi:hypothetical protein
MSNDDKGGCLTAAALALVCLVVGFSLGSKLMYMVRDGYWQREAVKHNAASYDPTTGAWRWNDESQRGTP